MISQETQHQKQIHQRKVWLSAGVFVKLILTKSWQKISMVQISAAWRQWYLSRRTSGKPIISHWAQITVKWKPQVTVMHWREIISLSLVQINFPCNITIRQTQENYSPLNIDFTLSYCLQCLNNWCNALSPSQNTVRNEIKLLNMIKRHPPPTPCENKWGSLSMCGIHSLQLFRHFLSPSLFILQCPVTPRGVLGGSVEAQPRDNKQQLWPRYNPQ